MVTDICINQLQLSLQQLTVLLLSKLSSLLDMYIHVVHHSKSENTILT